MRGLLLVIPLLLLHAAGPAHGQSDDEPEAITVRIALGESIEIAALGVRVRFAEVVEDSRCPLGATCIWEGNARVRLHIDLPGGEEAGVHLNTHPELVSAAALPGAGIRLTAVEPRRDLRTATDPDGYRITLDLSLASSM